MPRWGKLAPVRNSASSHLFGGLNREQTVIEPFHESSPANFSNPENIKSSVLAALPFAFANSGSDDASSFRERYVSFSDFVAKATKSPLSSETGRYQSLLLYLSLLFAGVCFLGPQIIKFDPFKEKADFVGSTTFMLLMSVLIVAVGTIFVLKALIEYKTNELSLIKDSVSSPQLTAFIRLCLTKTIIDRYNWLCIFDEIGATYKLYSDTTADVLRVPKDFTHIPLKHEYIVDLDELAKVPELANVIAARREFVNKALSALQKDRSNFEDLIKPIIGKYEKTENSEPNDDTLTLLSSKTDFHDMGEIENSFSTTLGKWFDARGDLSLNELHISKEDPLTKMEKDVVNLVKRSKLIRRTTLCLEIIFPLAFAIIVLGASWFFKLYPISTPLLNSEWVAYS
jgi:hypothetical protein